MDCSGVYKIENTISGKVYIGSSVNVAGRFRQHKAALRSGKHKSKHLQSSWDKHGEEAFTFSLLEEVRTEDLYVCENEWIESYKALATKLYNVRLAAQSNLGIKFSEEVRAKMAKSQTGKIIPPATRKRMRAANLGKVLTEAHKEKMRAAALNREISQETRKKMYATRSLRQHQRKLDAIIRKWRNI